MVTCACGPDRPVLSDYYVRGSAWTAERRASRPADLEAKVARLRQDDLDIWEIGGLHVCGRCNVAFEALPGTSENGSPPAPS